MISRGLSCSQDCRKRQSSFVVGLRPKDFEDASLDTDGMQTITAQISAREALGYEVIAHFDIDAKRVVSEDALDIQADDAMVSPITTDVTPCQPEIVQ